jgi:hypothetical protein
MPSTAASAPGSSGRFRKHGRFRAVSAPGSSGEAARPSPRARQVPYACIAGIEGYHPPGPLHAAPRDDCPKSPPRSARSESGRRDSAWSHPQRAPVAAADADADMSGDGDICLSVF